MAKFHKMFGMFVIGVGFSDEGRNFRPSDRNIWPYAKFSEHILIGHAGTNYLNYTLQFYYYILYAACFGLSNDCVSWLFWVLRTLCYIVGEAIAKQWTLFVKY